MDTEKVGYQRLADFMAWEPSLAIFPRFRSANMLCLLQMQAEITELEEQINDLAYVDSTTGDETRKELPFDWSMLKTLGEGSLQYRLHAKLRILLAEYSKLFASRSSCRYSRRGSVL
jgi:hypothetical protein